LSNDHDGKSLNIQKCCPKGIYMSIIPDDPTIWQGVLFPRKGIDHFKSPSSTIFHTNINESKGPFQSSVLRFQISFQTTQPIIVFQTDIFHPLISNADNGRFSLTAISQSTNIPIILYHLRAAFEEESLLDDIQEKDASNESAWYAWRSHRNLPFTRTVKNDGDELNNRPGGARRPREWNWDGVWEERVNKCVRESSSDGILYSNAATNKKGDGIDMVRSNIHCIVNVNNVVLSRLNSQTWTKVIYQQL